jgi:protein O-mannosyl-transferase
VRYDDDDYIAQNSHVNWGLTWDGIKWAFTSLYAANWHPLTWLSHMLDVSLFGLRAGGHHLVSLLFHTGSVLLLFWFLCRATRRLWPSALVAALFAVHPLHVESVAWAAERKDVLSAFFWFATMLAYASYAEKPGVFRYVRTLVLFGLGLLAKPMLVTLPLVLLMLDYWPLERFSVERDGWKPRMSGIGTGRLLLEKAPLLAMAAVSSAITLKAQTAAIASFDSLTFATRLANAAVSYGRYAWAMIWPQGLAVFYPFATSVFAAKLVCSILLLVTGTAAALYLGRRHRYVLVGWFWYVLTLLPVIGLVQVGWQSHADRYTYIPLTGLFIIVAWALAHAVDRRPQLRTPIAICAMIVVVAMSALTFRQVGFWKDELSVCRRAVEVSKHNPAMLANLGAILGERGEPQEGLAALHEAYKYLPENAGVITSIGSVLSRMGRFQESLDYFDKAIRIQPGNRDAMMGMATALARLGRTKEAEKYCRTVLEGAPDKGDGWLLLGIILGQQGRLDDAMDAFRRAAEAHPGIAAARLNMAKIYVQRGQMDMALEECRKSIAMEPQYGAYEFMGMILLQQGRSSEAEQAYRNAIRLNPTAASVYFNLGVLLDKQGRRKEAADEIARAASLDPANKTYVEYLQRLRSSEQ